MKNAAEELLEKDPETEVADITVSCDGTLNGIVTVISIDSGKCLDYKVLSKVCVACSTWESRKESNPEEYDTFTQTHECPINHVGSAGAMESARVVDCFGRSLEKRKLRYLNYIGDGDSKSFSEVVASDPYPGKTIEKLESVGHVQKRVGSRLRSLKAKDKVRLKDGKTLGGKGRLTDKMINKLQNYFGLAIRQNTGNTVYQLKKAIGAVLFHCSEAPDSDTRHQMCPRTADSWCKYHASKLDPSIKYKESIGLPTVIREKITPIFQSLSDDNLLSKCLHGKTQNNNEGINGVIWKRCPKDVFVGRSTLEIGVASAVIGFNDGAEGMLSIFDLLNISYGMFTEDFCTRKDSDRVTMMERKSSTDVKARRKRLRSVRKALEEGKKVKFMVQACFSIII